MCSAVHIYPLADQFVCLENNTDKIWVLNAVAARMLQLVKEGVVAEKVSLQIAREFDVDHATVVVDLERFVQSMQDFEGIAHEQLEAYEPDTGFIPNREFKPLEQQSYYLPGFHIVVDSELPGLHSQLQAMFKLTSSISAEYEKLHLQVFDNGDAFPVVASGKTLDTGYTLADAAIKCLREINGLVARHHEWTTVFHASSVARGGVGVLIPALGGSGKSTLAAYLMHCGYAFLNDDAVPLLTQTGKLLPVPLSLSIKSGSWSVLQHAFPELAQLQSFGSDDRRMKYLPPVDEQVQKLPVSCGLVLIPEFRPSAQTVELIKLSEVQVFEQIIRSGCIVDRPVNPEQLDMLVAWLDGMPCYRIVYASLADAETVISTLLARLACE